jgi:ATP-binding cassette subfamily B protein
MRGGFGGGPMAAMGSVQKPKDFKGTIKKLMGYLRPYLPTFILVILLAAGSAAFAIVGPKILGNATTKIFEGLVSKVSGAGGAGIDFAYVGNTVLLLLGIMVSVPFLLYSRLYHFGSGAKGILQFKKGSL